jgi:transcriptional regulator with XRE-family HTH domain
MCDAIFQSPASCGSGRQAAPPLHLHHSTQHPPQPTLGGALGLTLQQVQKYEKGTNRIGASRLQHICHILQVSESCFFEGAPTLSGASVGKGAVPSPSYVSDFLATSDGLALTEAFMLIKERALRRRIVHLVQEIADHDPINNGRAHRL